MLRPRSSKARCNTRLSKIELGYGSLRPRLALRATFVLTVAVVAVGEEFVDALGGTVIAVMVIIWGLPFYDTIYGCFLGFALAGNSWSRGEKRVTCLPAEVS
eukprot:scaffold2438_cov167-Amphora_coffeaeformis.AAC.18